MTAISYARGEQLPALLHDTIGARLRETAREHPDREAVVSVQQGIRLTYAELDDTVDRLATGLLRRGVEPGDRIGVWAPNCVEWTLVQYATARIGAILVNVNPAYRTHELRYAMHHSGVRLLFAEPAFKSSDYRRMVAEVRDDLPALEGAVFFGDDEWNGLASTAADPDAIAERASGLDVHDAVNIQYTSGTTSAPKGVTLTHHNILNNGFLVGELCGYTPADRICVTVPLYHCFGVVMGNLGALTHGSCVVLPGAGFDPSATLRAVAAERCTSLYGVPTMFIAMLADPSFAEHDLSTLRTGIMAGSPCPSEVMKRVVDDMHMRDVAICYGMTETSPCSTQTRRDDPLRQRVETIGRVGPHLEVQVVDELGVPVPRGVVGELCTRGYSVMRGYWNDPGRTAEAIDGDGWMHTGDLAAMDEDGYLRIVGRSKDLIIRGGENVYPLEVEEFLFTHPDVVDAQVVGVPDARLGEELCAWIRMRAGAEELTSDAVRAFCRDRIAHYKIPRYVLVVEEFPTTVTGKVRKNDMRSESIVRLGLTAEDAATA